MASIIRLKPGPDVAVIDLAPAQDAPIAEQIELISSSICMHTPPTSLNLHEILSIISVAGVIG
jgi:hypothetical protein